MSSVPEKKSLKASVGASWMRPQRVWSNGRAVRLFHLRIPPPAPPISCCAHTETWNPDNPPDPPRAINSNKIELIVWYLQRRGGAECHQERRVSECDAWGSMGETESIYFWINCLKWRKRRRRRRRRKTLWKHPSKQLRERVNKEQTDIWTQFENYLCQDHCIQSDARCLISNLWSYESFILFLFIFCSNSHSCCLWNSKSSIRGLFPLILGLAGHSCCYKTDYVVILP